MKKRFLCLFLGTALAASSLTACGSENEKTASAQSQTETGVDESEALTEEQETASEESIQTN